MPRPFEVSTPTPASVAQVHAAFGSQEYWDDRLAEYGAGSITLDVLEVDADGTVRVKTIQNMRNDTLPKLIARAVPGDLKVFREETWRTAGDEVHGDIVMNATGAPISGTGTAGLTPTADGSLLRFSGTIQVRVPLIGGQIEKYISSQIVEEIPGVQRFTTRWIQENGVSGNA